MFIVLLISIWHFSSKTNREYFFNKQVLGNSYEKVINVEQKQYNLGMHSPYVFQFELTKKNQDIIDKMIEKHHLKRETRIPYIVKNTPFIIDELNINLYQLMKQYPFYLILYETDYDSGERILIVTDDKIIFHTTGFVEGNRLKKVGYWYDENRTLQGVVDKSLLYGVY